MSYFTLILILSIIGNISNGQTTTLDSTTVSDQTTLIPTDPPTTQSTDASTLPPNTTITTLPPTTPTEPPTTTTPTDPPTTTVPTDPPTTTTPVPTTPPPENIELVSNSFTWNPSQSSSIIVKVDEGYSISVTVSDLDIDANTGSYLLIKEADISNSDGRVFSNKVTNPRKYLFKTSTVFAHSEAKDPAENKFTVVFERTGEPPTTTSTTTTTVDPWPTTEAGDSIYFTGNVSGFSLDEYRKTEVVEHFKSCVQKMASIYCNIEDINLLEAITTKNVVIRDIVQCPYMWLHSEICVQITFKVPIFHDEAKWPGYQLNSEHLAIMWDRYADQYLTDGFEVYSAPDIDTIVTWWAIGITAVTLIFILLLWFLRQLSFKFRAYISRRNRRRNSDTMSIVSSKRNSNISLEPHYLQDTPKFFEL